MTNAVELNAAVERLTQMANIAVEVGSSSAALAEVYGPFGVEAAHQLSADLLAALRSGQQGEPVAVGWMWKSQGGTLKLTTWHPDSQAETAERVYTLASSVAPLQIAGEGGDPIGAKCRLSVIANGKTIRDAYHPSTFSDPVAAFWRDIESVRKASPTPRADGLSDQGSSAARIPTEDFIPSGVYWSEGSDNFYSGTTINGMGVEFYHRWFARRLDFPQSRQAILDDRHISNFVDSRAAQDSPASTVGTARSDVNPDNADGLSDGEGSK